MNKKIDNIILDAGHGGIDASGVYTTNGKYFKFPNGEIAYEGVFNRNITKVLADKLKLKGYNVVFTIEPSKAEDISLNERVRRANNYSNTNSLFISIHNNASDGISKARGFEIFTTKKSNNSDRLAEYIYKEVEKLYKVEGLSMRSDMSDGDHDKEADFYVIKNVNMPAVLIECLFFDNYDDYKKLINSTFITHLAESICEGIIKYINQ